MKKILLTILSTSLFMLVGCNKQVDSHKKGVEIKHAFGKTIIDKTPKRIVTIGWGNYDTALALGITPVGVEKANFGKLEKNGLPVWSNNKAKTSIKTFSGSNGVNFEAISSMKPDVILASYSGITKKDYERLAKIAPTVAYPSKPWETKWREQTLINSKGINKEDEGKKLVEEVDEKINKSIKKYPKLKNKKVVFTWINPADFSQFYVYLPNDPRANYLLDLGFKFPEKLKSLPSNSFSATVSKEQVELLNDADILVTYGDETTLKQLQNNSIYGQVKAIKKGNVLVLNQNSILATAATPTILSIPNTVDDYLKAFNEIVEK